MNSTPISKVLNVIHTISKVMMYIGCVVIMFMSILTFVDVFGRYVFNRPITGCQEITEFLMPVVLYCGLAYATYARQHVTVDFVTSKCSQKVQIILAGICSLLCLLVSVPCALRLTQHAISIWGSSRVATAILNIKLYPFYTIAAIGNWWVSIEFLLDAIARFCEAGQHGKQGGAEDIEGEIMKEGNVNE